LPNGDFYACWYKGSGEREADDVKVEASLLRRNTRTWSTPIYTDIPNPGSSMEVTGLRHGLWVLICNDTERGHHSLLVAISNDEGQTWKWRHLERNTSGNNPASFHYPTLIQAHDGSLHATYSYTPSGVKAGEPSQSIKHVHFSVEWVKQG
jgi:predicted neuraminidase